MILLSLLLHYLLSNISVISCTKGECESQPMGEKHEASGPHALA